MAEVYTHSKWGTAQSLRSQGIEVKDHDAYTDVVLPEPAYGETIVGELLMDERAMFAELQDATNTLERLGRDYMGRSLERFGGVIRNSDVNKALHEQIKQEDVEMTFGSEEEKHSFFRLQRKVEVLRANLYWAVSERFNCHDWIIGVRSKWRAVKVRSKA